MAIRVEEIKEEDAEQENRRKPDVPSGLNEFHFGGSNALKVERVVMHPVSFHFGCPEIRPAFVETRQAFFVELRQAFVEMRQLVLYIGLAMVISLCVVLCGLAYLTSDRNNNTYTYGDNTYNNYGTVQHYHCSRDQDLL